MSKTILAVDDSKTIRQMVSFALRSAGYEVIEAIDGLDALVQLKVPVSAVVTDLNMPNMDGIELIKAIRGHNGYRFTPVVMLTTEAQIEKVQAGRAAGATAWIVKPFTAEQLLAVVRKVVG